PTKGARMKAEHRKELQTNALADRLGRMITGLKKARPNVIFYWIIGLMVVLALGVWMWVNKRNKAARAEVLVTMDNLPTLGELRRASGCRSGKSPLVEDTEEKLEEVIEKYPGSRAALRARFFRAQIDFVVLGLDRLQPSQAREALRSLKKARKQYEE